MPKADYEDRKAEKLERYKELAEKRHTEAEETLKTAKKMADVIPFGQPILVGHHSEQRDRNYRNKIDNKFEKAFETSNKAKYYDGKVSSMQANYAISQDDPEAIKKLKEKIQGLIKQHAKWKAVKVNPIAKSIFDKDSRNWKSLMLNSTSAEIRRCKKRIEVLEKMEKITDQEWKNSGITLEVNKDENRIMLYFPGKPEQEIRTILKRHGFRWSPRNTAWQSYINDYNLDFAKKEILKLES